MNPALLELFSWISLEMELGSHSAAAASWRVPRGWNSNIPLAPHLPPEPGQAEGRHQICSHAPFSAFCWPQCLMPSTCQGRGPGLVPSSVHMALLVPFWACPGPRSSSRMALPVLALDSGH